MSLRLRRVKKSPGISINPVWLHARALETILLISRITLRSLSFYETYRANLQLHNLPWATHTQRGLPSQLPFPDSCLLDFLATWEPENRFPPPFF